MIRPIVRPRRGGMACPVRRASSGSRAASTAWRRDELDVLEPRVRERTERRTACSRLARCVLGGPSTRRGTLGLHRLDELDDATARLVLGQLPRGRPAAHAGASPAAVAGEPSCAPSRRRTRSPSALRHLTAHTGSPGLAASRPAETPSTAGRERTSEERPYTPVGRADQLERTNLGRADQPGGPICPEFRPPTRFCRSRLRVLEPISDARMFAMQKVEGSSPFSRSSRKPGSGGVPPLSDPLSFLCRRKRSEALVHK